ncbi:4114_t:CDS:2 [Paraglomus occultum]|uniref:4114_t:CDS:1 n=1 Tax=Paraglomus occultum TaxID=144539 RepID=A0A9N9AF82_9GLOM|nr:4114_t:CDS:2 [Paraglomus occultum]
MEMFQQFDYGLPACWKNSDLVVYLVDFLRKTGMLIDILDSVPLPKDPTNPSSIYNLPPSAAKFKIRDIDLLRVGFAPASNEDIVIPPAEVTNFPKHYVLPNINGEILARAKFDVHKFGCISDPKVQTFFDKLHDVVFNGLGVVGTDETFTDTLVDDLLRIVELNDWPLKIRNHPPCRLYIEDEPCVSSIPEFVIKNKGSIFVGVEDKHLKNVRPSTDYGESQIAVEVLACGNEDIRSVDRQDWKDQTIYVVRVISRYVTFYKAVIPASYWEELLFGLPKQQSIVIKRWPGANGLRTGFDLAEPDGRQKVLTALIKIRQYLI